MEIRSVRFLIVSLVQALVALVQALVALLQAYVDLVQALSALVQAQPPQRGLIWVVRRQVVVGPESGLVVAVWWVFVRWKQVCYLQVVCELGVGFDKSVVTRPRGELATLTLMLHQGRNNGG